MKIKYLALVAFCGCALPSPTWAQALTQPASVRPAALSNDNTGYDYRYYDDQEEPSPSDAAAPQAQAAPAAEPVADEPVADEPVVQTTHPCEACCVAPCCCCCDNPFLFGPAEPFVLFPGENGLGIRAGFWTQVGYHTEGVNGVGDTLFNNYPNRVQLQQQWFFLEKAVDTGGDGFDWGFRMDYVYGTDGPNTQAFGGRPDEWDFGWNHGGAYGHAIPQLYAEVGYNDLKAKIGHFFAIEGYEVVPATGNFFYSHAFEFAIAEPFTHTGVLLEQKLTDNVTVLGGWTAGWDTGFTRNGGSQFLGGVKLQLTDNMQLSYQLSFGDFGFDVAGQPGSDRNGYAHTVLFTWELTDRWTYVCMSDFEDNDILLGATQNALSFSNYVFYTVNDRWSLGTRLEWFKDPLLGGPGNLGASGEVIDLTVGANYRPAANVVIRPEVRWDDFHDANPLQDTCLFGIDTVITY